MKSFFILLNRLFVNKFFIILFCILLFSSSIISFILKINLSSLLGPQDLNPFLLEFDIKTRTGGVVNDLATHWQYITYLKENIANLLKLEMGVDTNLINFPLHNIIFSQIYFFNDSLKNYLFIVFITSLLLPIIFFLCLRNKFKNINKYNLILLSSLIYLFPAFQYSAIWGNNHIIALIFLTIGIFFHLKLKDCNYNSFKYYFLTVFFASLACYTRQYYVFFFLYLLLDFYLEFKIKYFLLNGIFLLMLALPGLFFLLNNQVLLTGMNQEVTNFTSAILVSSSIVFFYMVPFFIQYFINLPKEEKKINKLFDIKIFLFSLFITIFCIYSFEYKGSVGGGIFYKIFFLIIKSKILFFCTSFIGIYYILFFSEKNIKNIFLSILILSTFTTGFFIFQKYFEPMFFILFLIYFDKNKILKSIEKNNFFYIIYFIGYYLIANYIYFFGL